MKVSKIKRKFCWDEKGAIEGLPLQLLIMVIIAGIAIAIILGWMLSIRSPNSIKAITPNPDRIKITGSSINQDATMTVTIKVTVYDQDNNPLKDVIVTLEGAGVLKTETDDADGKVDGVVTFNSVTVRLPAGVQTGEISIRAQKSGYPQSQDSIPVFRG